MRKLIPLIFLLCSIPLLTYAQKYRNSGLFVEIYLTQGGVLKSNEFVRGENKEGKAIESFSATDLRFGWQTQGTQVWHHTFNLPYYGIGLYNIVFSNEDEIGYPAAAYFFFGAPFMRKKNFSFDYEFSFGLSYNWKPYNDINNPFNVAIGSYENAYIDAKIKHVWYFSKRFSLDSSIRFTHFSNGAIRLPNKGINLIAPSLGLRYDIKPRNPQPVDRVKGNENKPTEELSVLITSGKRSVKGTNTSNQQMVSLLNLSIDYLKPAGNIFKYGVGIDVGFDENRSLLIDGNDITLASKKKQIFAGVSIIGQFRANRLGVQAGIGYDIINDNRTQNSNNFYQRIGLRYYFFKTLFAGINIKAKSFSVADYIEWSIGYSFSK